MKKITSICVLFCLITANASFAGWERKPATTGDKKFGLTHVFGPSSARELESYRLPVGTVDYEYDGESGHAGLSTIVIKASVSKAPKDGGYDFENNVVIFLHGSYGSSALFTPAVRKVYGPLVSPSSSSSSSSSAKTAPKEPPVSVDKSGEATSTPSVILTFNYDVKDETRRFAYFPRSTGMMLWGVIERLSREFHLPEEILMKMAKDLQLESVLGETSFKWRMGALQLEIARSPAYAKIAAEERERQAKEEIDRKSKAEARKREPLATEPDAVPASSSSSSAPSTSSSSSSSSSSSGASTSVSSSSGQGYGGAYMPNFDYLANYYGSNT